MAVLNPPPIIHRNLDRAPLSFSQESLWFLHQLDPQSVAYNSVYLFVLKGDLDRAVLHIALHEIIRRHSVLRTVYRSGQGIPGQAVLPFQPVDFPFIDLSDMPRTEQEAAARQYAVEQGYQPFDLARSPLVRLALLRVSAQEHFLFFATHHIAFDAWSRNVFITELEQAYSAARRGDGVILPDPRAQYTDYAAWQRDWLQGETLETLLAYWKMKLDGDLPVIDLPTARPRPEVQTHRGARHFFQIPDMLTSQIRSFCRQERITPFTYFAAAYGLLLQRYTGQDDILVGCPFANRLRPETDRMLGMFVNTLPLRLDLSGKPTVRELLVQLRTVVMEAIQYQALPFERLVAHLDPERDLGRTPVYQVLINMRNVPRRSRSSEELHVEDMLREDASAAYDLSFEINEKADSYTASFRYNLDLFDEAAIARKAGQLLNLLHQMLANPDVPITSLDLLLPSERHQLLVEWNNTQSEFPDVGLHELFQRQAVARPEATAIICRSEKVTYMELERRSNRLARYLQSHGAGPGKLIAIALPRSILAIAAQLAVLKTGSAFLSLDPTYPADRTAYMLADADPLVVLSDDELSGALPAQAGILNLERDESLVAAFSDTQLDLHIEPEKLAYLFYTSGSTGRPKGVFCHHRGAVNFIHHMITSQGLKPGERVLQLTAFSFDASVRDTLGTLAFGGTILLMDDSQMRDVRAIVDAFEGLDPDCILSIVPTMLRAISEEASGRNLKDRRLRLVMPSGEALLWQDAELVQRAFGSAVQLVNQYGPTECSMISTVYPLAGRSPDHGERVPIGRPIANVRAYVLDPALAPVPQGAKGELYIGGEGVGLGYLNRPELTADRFIPDPFSQQAGARLYRTGDIARYLPDGCLEYLGRGDRQVKIRGYRVELGEIEAVLREYPLVSEAAVVLWEAGGPAAHLAAYVVRSDRRAAASGLRDFLAEKLPFYMVPASITFLEAMPLTPNRKIDRRALPVPDRNETDQRYSPPETENERHLAAIWQELLQVERVGVTDNFFDLGGHSLLAVRLFARIEQELGWKLPLAVLFQHGTIRELVRLSETQATEPDQVFVTMQPDGRGAPLFLVPGVGASPLYMRDLALMFVNERPVVGLQSAFLWRTSRRYSIPETARFYVDEVRKMLPEGPYLLAGHSGGGYVALEMARLLMNEGHPVQFLGMIDTYPPGRRHNATPLERIQIHLSNLQGKAPAETLVYLRGSLERWFSRSVGKLPGEKRVAEAITQIAPQKLARQIAMRSYDPQPFAGALTLFQASERPWYVRWDVMANWSSYLRGKVEQVRLPGDHLTLLRQPHVSDLAQAIRSRLPDPGSDRSGE